MSVVDGVSPFSFHSTILLTKHVVMRRGPEASRKMRKGKNRIPGSSRGSDACLLLDARAGLIMDFLIKTKIES